MKEALIFAVTIYFTLGLFVTWAANEMGRQRAGHSLWVHCLIENRRVDGSGIDRVSAAAMWAALQGTLLLVWPALFYYIVFRNGKVPL